MLKEREQPIVSRQVKIEHSMRVVPAYGGKEFVLPVKETILVLPAQEIAFYLQKEMDNRLIAGFGVITKVTMPNREEQSFETGIFWVNGRFFDISKLGSQLGLGVSDVEYAFANKLKGYWQSEWTTLHQVGRNDCVDGNQSILASVMRSFFD